MVRTHRAALLRVTTAALAATGRYAASCSRPRKAGAGEQNAVEGTRHYAGLVCLPDSVCCLVLMRGHDDG
jgi:hypothetical protein